MIKLKDLLLESYLVTDREFYESLKQAKKETGAKDKIPSKLKKMCADVKKQGFHKIGYDGKPGKAREPHKLMYQYYAYIQGWGHTKFKTPWDWTDDKSDKILQWFYSNHHNAFRYDYLLYNVTTDLQATQVVSHISPGETDVEPAYYLVKEYLNMFGTRGKIPRDEKIVIAKVEWWLNKNKVKTR